MCDYKAQVPSYSSSYELHQPIFVTLHLANALVGAMLHATNSRTLAKASSDGACPVAGKGQRFQCVCCAPTSQRQGTLQGRSNLACYGASMSEELWPGIRVQVLTSITVRLRVARFDSTIARAHDPERRSRLSGD